MRSLVCRIATVSFLFVSIEGAADVVVDGMLHGDATSHQEEFGHPLDAHGGELSDTELDGEHCNHCCHGHCSGITHYSDLTTSQVLAHENPHDRYIDHLRALLLTPPTPPPDARNLS